MYSEIAQSHKRINLNNSLNSALRHAIYGKIMDFTKTQILPLKCIKSNSINNCKIGHIFLFHHIRTEFMKTINKDEIPVILEDDVNNTCCHIIKSSDDKFKKQ